MKTSRNVKLDLDDLIVVTVRPQSGCGRYAVRVESPVPVVIQIDTVNSVDKIKQLDRT